MANVGTAASGQVLQGSGNGLSPTFKSIGVNSGLTTHGVVIAEGNNAFTATATGTAMQVLTSNGPSSDPTFQSISASGGITTLTGDTGSASPTAGNVNVQGGSPLSAGLNGSVTSGTGSTLTVTSINCAKWIVDPVAGRGTHTTISGALAAASSGQTIFIRPGTYTENPTLVAGVNLTAFECDAINGNVTIIGNCTATFAGTCVLTGIRLQTNSASMLTLSGSNATIVKLLNCYLNDTSTTGAGITFSVANTASMLTIDNCFGDMAAPFNQFYSMSSTGQLIIRYCYFTSSGSNTSQSTNSSGSVQIFFSTLLFPIGSSSTGSLTVYSCDIDCSLQNNVALFPQGTGNGAVYFSRLASGTSAALAIGTGVTYTVLDCIIDSTNTNAISGSGTILYQDLIFSNTSAKINPTVTQTGGLLKGSQNQAPSAGFLGEQIRSAVASGSPVSITSGTAANITSISLTAGVWDVSGIITFLPSAITGTNFVASVSATSVTSGTTGDNRVDGVTAPTAAGGVSLTIPSYRVTTTTTISYFLVAFASYTVGTLTACGRISATRVG